MDKKIEVKTEHNLFQKIDNFIKTLDVIDTFIIIIAIIIHYSRKKVKEIPHILDLINHNKKKDRQIVKYLDDLREKSNSNRVIIGVFHNTSVYGFNYHLLKMSVFHESLRDLNYSLKKEVKDIPLSYLSEEFSEFEKNKNKKLFNIKSLDIKEGCKRHLNQINTEVIINYLLEYNHTPVAILSFQFFNSDEFEFLTIEEFESSLNKKLNKEIDYYIDNIVKEIVK